MTSEIVHDIKASAFYIVSLQETAYINYIDAGVYIDIYETYVAPEYRGHKYASQLVKYAMEYAKKKNLKIRPTCPFVQKFFERYYEYSDLKYRGN